MDSPAAVRVSAVRRELHTSKAYRNPRTRDTESYMYIVSGTVNQRLRVRPEGRSQGEGQR